MDLVKAIETLNARIAELEARRATLVQAAQIADELEEGQPSASASITKPFVSRQPPKDGDKRLRGGLSIGDAV